MLCVADASDVIDGRARTVASTQVDYLSRRPFPQLPRSAFTGRLRQSVRCGSELPGLVHLDRRAGPK